MLPLGTGPVASPRRGDGWGLRSGGGLSQSVVRDGAVISAMKKKGEMKSGEGSPGARRPGQAGLPEAGQGCRPQGRRVLPWHRGFK